MTADLPPLDAAVLPGGARARFVPGVNGLTVHMLEAREPGRPCLLLLPDAALAVCVAEYQRIGFQGGLQWYRMATSGQFAGEMELFTGRTIDVPSLYLSGKRDWGVFQSPGAYERMQKTACTDMRSCSLIEGAGHWSRQEKPADALALLLPFPKGLG